ncbi:MAG: aminotransferase class V-fold PLP-dependent enzyme, partial [Ignavibacteriae bacterium]|nr:aminotransferase class V-fold PLP-dependent enzyme [Ignavibacteriota bacterium]
TLRNYLIKKIQDVFGDNVVFNSKEENCLYNIVNVSFNTEKLSLAEDMLLIRLDLKGIAVSGGSACTSGALKPSRVLLEIGKDEKTAMASLRISFGRKNKISEIDGVNKVGALVSLLVEDMDPDNASMSMSEPPSVYGQDLKSDFKNRNWETMSMKSGSNIILHTIPPKIKIRQIIKIAYPFVARETMIAIKININVKGFFLTEFADNFGKAGYLNLLTINRDNP